MARYTCAISGIQFTTEHFSFTLPKDSGYFHPIFALSQKDLMILSQSAPVFTSIERYMHFLAMMHSTEAIRWNSNAIFTPVSARISSQCWEKLLHIVGQVNIIRHPSFKLPQLNIYRDTHQLQSVDGWLFCIEEAFKEWHSSYKSLSVTSKIARRKEVLEQWIKNPQKDIKQFGYVLADWASVALQFPNGKVRRSNGTVVIADYWKQIIVSCATDIDIFSVPDEDLVALIDYCELNLEMGSIYSHALMQHLYTGRTKKSNFLGTGDVDMAGSYRILDSGTPIELANKLAIIDAAPQDRPTPEKYPNKLSYLRAKLRYEMATKVAEQQADLTPVVTVQLPDVLTPVSDTPVLHTSFGEL